MEISPFGQSIFFDTIIYNFPENIKSFPEIFRPDRISFPQNVNFHHAPLLFFA